MEARATVSVMGLVMGLGSGSPSETALPSCLPPPPFLPDDISLKNRFLTSAGLIEPILVPPERGEPPLDSRKEAAIQELDTEISSSGQARTLPACQRLQE